MKYVLISLDPEPPNAWSCILLMISDVKYAHRVEENRIVSTMILCRFDFVSSID